MTTQLASEARTTGAVIPAETETALILSEAETAVILSEASQRDAQSKDPDDPRLTTTARTVLPAILLFALLLTTHPAHAQGCAQCLDSTRATPPAVQAAYRHAIYLLIGAASTIFLIGLYLLRPDP